MEEKISFQSDSFNVSGMFEDQGSEKGVVVTHPHPLYGGDMFNSVVTSIQRACLRAGYTTLRFNFRGVGESQGQYTEGIGEQEDVRAAVRWLFDKGVSRVDLAGYSFGVWVNVHAVMDGISVENLIMVSPPVAFMDFSRVRDLKNHCIVFTGSRDDIAPPNEIENLLPTWRSDAVFRIIEGADHFYFGYDQALTEQIEKHLTPTGEG